MTGVLRPDDLGWLTLILKFFTCLNLNSIMIEVFGPGDLGWLTLTLSFFRYSNLNLSVLLKISIWVNDTYCGGQLSHMFKLHWKRLGPISSLICTDCIRMGRAQYPVRG